MEASDFYHAEGGEDVAHDFVASMESAFRLISARPKIGRPRTDLRPGLRSFPVGAYMIYYRELGTFAEVVRILHQRRDAQKAFGITRRKK